MLMNSPDNIIMTLTNRLIRVPLGLINFILRDYDASLVNYTLRSLYIGHKILGLDRTGKKASRLEDVAFIAATQYNPDVVDQNGVTNTVIAAWAMTKWDIRDVSSFFVLPPPTQLMFCVGNPKEDPDDSGLAFECYDVTVFDSNRFKEIAGAYKRYRVSYSGPNPSSYDYRMDEALSQFYGKNYKKEETSKDVLTDDGINHIAAIRGTLSNYPEDIKPFLKEHGFTHIFYRLESEKPTWRNSALEAL